MHHIIYLSRATAPLTARELVDLLRQAQAANNEANVTGLLVYHEGRFIQILEGEQQAVAAIYARIVRDPRHRDIVQLADQEVAERTFLAWSMTFQELEAARFNHLVYVASQLPPVQLQRTALVPHPAYSALLRQLRDLVLPHAAVPPAAA